MTAWLVGLAVWAGVLLIGLAVIAGAADASRRHDEETAADYEKVTGGY